MPYVWSYQSFRGWHKSYYVPKDWVAGVYYSCNEQDRALSFWLGAAAEDL